MSKADKKKAKKDRLASVKPARVTELADNDLERVQGGLSSAEHPFIKPRK